MIIIGITGGTGAGKTTATRALKSLGALILDCDELYHKLLIDNEFLKSDLETRFGDVLSGGVIDRKRLSDIVWNDPSALLDLNTITHGYVSEAIGWEIERWKEQGGHIVAIDAIAIFESGIRDKCDVVVGINAPVETRISRIMERDGITSEQAEMRRKAQKQAEFYRRNCDYFLENTYESPTQFEEKCMVFFTGLINAHQQTLQGRL